MRTLLCIVLVLGSQFVRAQTPVEKHVNQYTQSWFSFNSTMRFSSHWGMVGDFHVRRDDFVSDDSFYFLRFGASYWVASKYPVIAGVAHLWLAPINGNTTWSNENRIYQQWSAITTQGRVSVLHRVRTEERWRDRIINDEIAGAKQFSFRLRYLASFDIKLFEAQKKPSLVVSDEVLVQFGESIVYNSFDQNRLFLGLKIPLNKKLSADVGYMNIFQQKPSGIQYDMSHVFRLFFYYNIDLSAKKNETGHQEENE